MLAHEKLNAAGITEPCTAADIDHCNAIVYVVKEGKEIRITIDLSTLNGFVERKEVIMPDMATFYNITQGASVFSDLDWRQFFHTFECDEATSRLFGFCLPDGSLGRFIVLAMGLHNSPAIAQEIVHEKVITPLRVIYNQTLVLASGTPRPQHTCRG